LAADQPNRDIRSPRHRQEVRHLVLHDRHDALAEKMKL